MLKQKKPIEHSFDFKSHGYEIGEQIGEGAFGKVFLCKKIEEPEIMAMKVIHMSANEEEMKSVMRDAEILKKLSHRNVIKYIDSFTLNQDIFCIIMEYAKEGNVREMIIENAYQKKTIAEADAYKIFAQMVQGMKYIHSKNIIHRDLKPENILLDTDGRIIICDFGLSTQMTRFSTKAQIFAGTLPYMAPEMLSDNKYGFSDDVWAAALIFLEILTTGKGKFTFKGKNKEEMLLDIDMTINTIIPQHVSESTKGLILSMLNFAEQRPTFEMLEKNHIIKKFIRQDDEEEKAPIIPQPQVAKLNPPSSEMKKL